MNFFQRAVHVRQGKQSKGAESRGMLEQHSCLELVADPGYFTQAMEIFQNDSRSERGDGRTDPPIIHRLQLRFSIRNLDRHRVVRILRRHNVVVHVEAPVSWCILIHVLFNSVLTQPKSLRYLMAPS